MNIQIVTDSTADLTPEMIEEFGINVVPAYVRFGSHIYRDRIDISEEELYQRLLSDPVHPSTEPPTPQDFASTYQKISQEADGIISIHISSKLSATYNSALRGKELVETDCPIEVIDSQLVTMGLGLLIIAVDSARKSTSSLQDIVEEAKRTIPTVRMFGLFDTLKYLARGGRISKTKSLIGSLLNVKPMLTMKNGELEPAGYVRNRSNGLDKLLDFTKNAANVQDLVVIYSTTPDEAQHLAERMDAIFNKELIKLARLGPALGVHGGPGILFVALRVQA
jgi:DegV family protein with EDD domain